MSCTDEASGSDRRPAARRGGGGGAPGDSAAGPEASDDRRNLYPLIFLGQVHGLNLSDPVAGARAPIKPWAARLSLAPYAESGTDDCMIITVPFTSPVTIKSVLLNPGTGDWAPRRIRLFVNRPHGLDFDDVEASEHTPAYAHTHAPGSSTAESAARAPRPAPDAHGVASVPLGAMRPATRPGATGDTRSGKPQADFALLEGVPGITEYPLGAARFTNVNSISIVIVCPRLVLLPRQPARPRSAPRAARARSRGAVSRVARDGPADTACLSAFLSACLPACLLSD